MAKNEYTQKKFYEEVIAAMADNENAVAMAKKKLAQLESKSSKSDTAKTEEQGAFMEVIRDVLAEATDPNGMSNAEMLADERIKSFPWKDGKVPTSSSRLTAYLTRMGEPTAKHPERMGDIKRVVVKKTPYFSLA